MPPFFQVILWGENCREIFCTLPVGIFIRWLLKQLGSYSKPVMVVSGNVYISSYLQVEKKKKLKTVHVKIQYKYC